MTNSVEASEISFNYMNISETDINSRAWYGNLIGIAIILGIIALIVGILYLVLRHKKARGNE